MLLSHGFRALSCEAGHFFILKKIKHLFSVEVDNQNYKKYVIDSKVNATKMDKKKSMDFLNIIKQAVHHVDQ